MVSRHLVRGAAAAAFLMAGLSAAEAAKVLVMSSENYDQDNKIVQVLKTAGHDVTLGSSFSKFGLSTDLRNFETVILQVNYNYLAPDMAARSQTYLSNFVKGGGGLVTTGWLGYVQYSWSKLKGLESLVPFHTRAGFRTVSPVTFEADAADATLNDGVPATFTTPADNITGTEEIFILKGGAIRYYTSTANNEKIAGLAGWTRGKGEVLSFSVMAGIDALSDENFARLFSNAVQKVAGTPNAKELYVGLESVVAPVVKVAGKRKIVTSKGKVRLKGSATGTFRVQRVEVQVGRKSSSALGTSQWAKNVRVKKGKTKCIVRAVDVNGFVSSPVKVTIVRK
jgi:hypothetical protein